MKTQTRKSDSGWKVTTALFTGALLMLGPGCICINNQLGVPGAGGALPGSYGGGGGQPPAPPPSGGNFAAVQAFLTGTTDPNNICGQPVTKKRVNFYPPAVPGPTGGETHFQGRLYNVTTAAFIPKTHYVLQYWVSLQNNGCANPVPGLPNDVRFPATANSYYQITAHFKSGYVPAGTPTIELQGAWVIPPP